MVAGTAAGTFAAVAGAKQGDALTEHTRIGWTADPAVGTERPTVLSCTGQGGPAQSNGAAHAGHDNRMWRNEGEQLRSSFNLTVQP